MTLDQCLFDTIMNITLTEVGSCNFLRELGIFCPENYIPWKEIIIGIENQTLKEGIYPKKYNKYTCHYYAVKRTASHIKSGGKLLIANGYSYKGMNNEYAIAMNVQPNFSHGLCQTFALMYYLGCSSLLIETNPSFTEGKPLTIQNGSSQIYFYNILIGLYFLLKLTKNIDWAWDLNKNNSSLKESFTPEIINFLIKKRLSNFTKGSRVYIFDLIKIIIDKKYRINLIKWYNIAGTQDASDEIEYEIKYMMALL